MNVGADTGGLEATHDAAIADTGLLEREDLLGQDGVVFDPVDLGDADDLARTVAESCGVDDDVHGRGDLLADRAHRQLVAGHQDHRLEAPQHVLAGCWRGRSRASPRGRSSWPGSCPAPRRHDTRRPRCGPAACGAQLRSRSRMVISPVPSRFAGRASSVTTWRWLQLQLRSVLDGDDALLVGDERGQHVERRRLAGTGAAGEEDVEPRLDTGLEEVEHLGRGGAEVDQVVDGELGARTCGR